MTASSSPPIHAYYAHLRRRGMFRHVGGLLRYPRQIFDCRLLVQNFFRRELFGRFRGSFLGVLWVLIQPLFLFGLYFLIFGYVFKTRLSPGEGPDPQFAIYLMSAILVITSFMEATTRSCTTVVENGNLVKKVAFPCEMLPVHLVAVATTVLAVGSVVMFSLGALAGVVQPGWSLLLWPVVLLVHMMLCVGVGLALACVHVFMRDAVHIWTIMGQAWMFLSPAFWWLPGESGIASKFPWAHWLQINPLYSLIQAHRHALGVTPSVIDGTLLGHLGVAAVWAFGMLALGYSLFMSRREKFADLV